jgi:hypothetical protein
VVTDELKSVTRMSVAPAVEPTASTHDAAPMPAVQDSVTVDPTTERVKPLGAAGGEHAVTTTAISSTADRHRRS